MGTTNMPRTHTTKWCKLCAKPPTPKPGPRDYRATLDFSAVHVTTMNPGETMLPSYTALTVPKP